MAEMNTKNIDLQKLMPYFMREDEAVKTLADKISQMLVDAMATVDAQTVYGYEDELSEEQCDELAWEWDIDWYDYNLTLEEKRATVKSAVKIKRHRGTKGAVLELLRSVYGSGELLEWFEYDGEPYHFKLRTDETRTPETEAIFTRRINQVKNVRSVLDAVETRREVNGKTYTIIGAVGARQPPAIIDGGARIREERSRIIATPAGTSTKRGPAVIDGGKRSREETSQAIAVSAGTGARRTPAIIDGGTRERRVEQTQIGAQAATRAMRRTQEGGLDN